MCKKEKNKFPKGFFAKERPIITSKEALKDVIPLELSNEQKKQTFCSRNAKKR